MLTKLIRFFDDIHRIADCIAANREIFIHLSAEDRDLLANYQRRRQAKKVKA